MRGGFAETGFPSRRPVRAFASRHPCVAIEFREKRFVQPYVGAGGNLLRSIGLDAEHFDRAGLGEFDRDVPDPGLELDQNAGVWRRENAVSLGGDWTFGEESLRGANRVLRDGLARAVGPTFAEAFEFDEAGLALLQLVDDFRVNEVNIEN